MKKTMAALAMAACINFSLPFIAFAQQSSTVTVPMGLTVDSVLEMTYWIREVPADEKNPYIPGTRDVTSMNFGQLKLNTTYNWYAPQYYFIAFLIPNTGQAPYFLKQSFSGFVGTNATTLNLSKSIIMTPQYCPDDRWTWFTNPTGTAQGDMPAEDSLGGEKSRKKVIDPTTGKFIYTGRWKTAGDPSAEIIYNGNSGKSQIIRCVYGVFTADNDYKTIHGAWPDGITNSEDGLILPSKLAGLAGAETISGSVTFTLTLQ